MVNCDTCGVSVSSKGYLGGGIVCEVCAKAKRQDDKETLEERINKYGGGEDYDGDIQELLY